MLSVVSIIQDIDSRKSVNMVYYRYCGCSKAQHFKIIDKL